MKFTLASVLALAASPAALALPQPGAKSALAPRAATVYATFYNDNACGAGQGIAVDTANPGCLTEHGRKSVFIQKTDRAAALPGTLVMSPDDNCSCQFDCLGTGVIGVGAHCYDLSGTNVPNANSLRWIGYQGCDANNC